MWHHFRSAYSRLAHWYAWRRLKIVLNLNAKYLFVEPLKGGEKNTHEYLSFRIIYIYRCEERYWNRVKANEINKQTLVSQTERFVEKTKYEKMSKPWDPMRDCSLFLELVHFSSLQPHQITCDNGNYLNEWNTCRHTRTHTHAHTNVWHKMNWITILVESTQKNQLHISDVTAWKMQYDVNFRFIYVGWTWQHDKVLE